MCVFQTWGFPYFFQVSLSRTTVSETVGCPDYPISLILECAIEAGEVFRDGKE